MEWEIEWGTDKDGKPLINDMLRWKARGMATPLDDRPEPPKSYAKYYEAYKVLSFSKNMNGNIPFSEITNFIAFYKVKNADKFIRVMYRLDAACGRASRSKNNG